MTPKSTEEPYRYCASFAPPHLQVPGQFRRAVPFVMLPIDPRDWRRCQFFQNHFRCQVRQVDITELFYLLVVVRANVFAMRFSSKRRGRTDKILSEKFIDVALPDLTPKSTEEPYRHCTSFAPPHLQMTCQFRRAVPFVMLAIDPRDRCRCQFLRCRVIQARHIHRMKRAPAGRCSGTKWMHAAMPAKVVVIAPGEELVVR
jgi:hypothetical protein